MSKINPKYTLSQQDAIGFRGKNMLVSASAGTGKTTVMIERIASLIEEGADVSEIVVVTFTNLAAAEMKARLAAKLSEKRDNPHVLEQLEKLDSASICTLHSFCSELLRNYFYVVDVDPAFAILDDATVATLKRNALDDLLAEYFDKDDDEAFEQVYKIFSVKRKESAFRETLMGIYGFSRCLENFDEWYAAKRENFARYSEDNPLVQILLNDLKQSVEYWQKNLPNIASRSAEDGLYYTDVFQRNAELVSKIKISTLEQTLNDVCKLQLEDVPAKKPNVPFGETEAQIRQHFKEVKEDFDDVVEKYSKLYRGEKMETLWAETQHTLTYTDKLVEMLKRFEQLYSESKKQRGGVDYDDLEHTCLQLLNDEPTRQEIRGRYKLVFVDEYQDTNPVQEAIITKLATDGNLFMVGDVKQSIYGFRGCEPSIFVDKYDCYKSSGKGHVVELNDNFRSNGEILQFVNEVFNRLMTPQFGRVDYRANSQLKGPALPALQTPSIRVDYLRASTRAKQEISQIYDITAPTSPNEKVSQGELIARRVKEYVGMVYYDKEDVDKTKPKRIRYGDIVILMRGLSTDKAAEIYNTLVARNVPVIANFKVDGLAVKEVRELVNLLRVVDNPYVDVSFVGTALSVFGGFTESELGHVRLDTDGRDVPMFERMQTYAEKGLNAATVQKIRRFFAFLEELRFYSRSASVDETVLFVLKKTNYHLYVQGLPNGALRLKKLYSFIDGLKGAPYAQSVDKFLSYVDETDNRRPEEGISQTNAVRMMTMHAAKGLEFPVVILAGLESRIQFDHDAVEQCFDLGLATRYYNFDTMRVAETLGKTACGLFNKNKQREEELRLLYVAMTRAKFVLNVVATVTPTQLAALPKLPTKAIAPLDWLLLVTKDMMSKQQLPPGLEINEHKEIVHGEETPSPQDLKCEQLPKSAEAKILQQLSYVYPHLRDTQMPSKIVSSALDKEYVDLTDEPQAEFTLNANADRSHVGTAYHKVYQYVPLNATVAQIEQTVAELVASGKIEQRFASEIDVQLVFDTLNNPQLASLLGGGKVYHEIPFMLNAPYSQLAKDKRFNDEVMLQGVIDLLVLREDKAVVIDFKYTSRSDLVEERYQMQLASYKLAVQKICGITDVETYVLSIADNKLIKM